MTGSPSSQGPTPGPASGRSRKPAVLIAVLIAVVLAVWGVVQRTWTYQSLSKETAEAALPHVQVISPQRGPARRKLSLPANISAWYQAPIYAQVSGYVKMWYTDIGAQVKKGDLLAEIETPGLDAQSAAAKANLNVALARYHLAQITAKRWQALEGTQAVSRQEVDVQAANATAQEALVEAAQHEAERFEALQGFKRIVAPFDGIVTSRFADVGDYVNAGRGDVSSNGTATELFSVADVHAMRVFVDVPQDYADIISPHLTASLTVPQYPDRKFTAKYLATAGAFHAATRTVRTELMVGNDSRELWPDSYATVEFEAPGDPNILILPEGALIFRAKGLQVATVDGSNHVHLVGVTAGNNLGTTVQILSGVKETDRIINNPDAGLLDGDEVRVVSPTRGYNDSFPEKPPARHSRDDIRAMPEGSASPDAGARQ
ncbi:efflux RND transporter periplasmic adaptor subunit [Acetobacter sp. AN02]|uniref:efflux RND transporter periplasmic adaptor subunit n=1 Tax=Acetobacter sp. AN02 TaxID=2894186 RepID=UPI00243461A9|nr:efflux RND transporter periplasmic adaptor subunit [Acetobacter sp. AN02]MDG6095131.1 efflux RND transporter periplasmic adaptor subunit [Acetobacter sp. AN02]